MFGLIHIYCGNGKGKTTAATGLAVRAAGFGKKVVFCQFFKNGTSSELKSFEKLENITVFNCRKSFVEVIDDFLCFLQCTTSLFRN